MINRSQTQLADCLLSYLKLELLTLKNKYMKTKIFNSQEVQAIIDDNKTMFREVCKAQPSFIVDEEKLNITFGSDFFKPKFKVGQEISVKHQESLITLKIKSVKVERLRDISNDDAIAEAPILFLKPETIQSYLPFFNVFKVASIPSSKDR